MNKYKYKIQVRHGVLKNENLMRKIDLSRKNGHSSTLLFSLHQVQSRIALFIMKALPW